MLDRVSYNGAPPLPTHRMRIVAALLLLLTLYFAGSLLWPSRYDISRDTPTAAPDSRYVREIRARAAPDDTEAFVQDAADLYSVRRIDEANALADWMQRRAWRRFVGDADAPVADVGEAIDAGIAARLDLPVLRGRVIERALAMSLDTGIDAALADLFRQGENPPADSVEQRMPGVWLVHKRRADGVAYSQYRFAVAVRNCSDSRVRALRLQFFWDGRRELPLSCEASAQYELAPSASTTLWCQDLAHGSPATIETVSDKADATYRLELEPALSHLALPDLGFEVPPNSNRYVSGAAQRADMQRHHVQAQQSCFRLGDCERIAFSAPALWIATFVLAFASIGVWVTARALGRTWVPVLLFGAYAVFSAGQRALLAADTDRVALSWPRVATWLACCVLLAAWAWTQRVTLSGERDPRMRPSPHDIFNDFLATAVKTSLAAFLVYAVLFYWFAASVLLHR